MYKFENLIEEVKELNTELKYGLDDIVGVTIEKGLIPTVANLTQTALDKFYIVKPETFIYNPRTHGVRLGMGYNETSDTYITSWNNVAFRVKETAQNIVLPQYLWLYFCRPIWDRITNFLAWGSSTIVFAWKDFLNIDIDLPSIEKQREIVEEYETLSRRIRLNEQIIEKLEVTAQALYRRMFVDGIDKENLPEGWKIGSLTEVATYLNGIACQKYETNESDFLPVLKIRELSQGYCDSNSDHVSLDIPNDFIINDGDFIFSWSATLFIDIWCGGKSALNQHLFKVSSKHYPKWYIFLWTLYHIDEWKRLISAKATSMGHIKREDLESAEVIIPSKTSLEEMNIHFEPLFDLYILKKKENLKLSEIQSLLLAKMGNLKQ